MKDSKEIPITNAVPLTYPSTGKLDPFEKVHISHDVTNVSLEFDYGLGFNETAIVQTNEEVAYLAPGVEKIKVTPNGSGSIRFKHYGDIE